MCMCVVMTHTGRPQLHYNNTICFVPAYENAHVFADDMVLPK